MCIIVNAIIITIITFVFLGQIEATSRQAERQAKRHSLASPTTIAEVTCSQSRLDKCLAYANKLGADGVLSRLLVSGLSVCGNASIGMRKLTAGQTLSALPSAIPRITLTNQP